MQHHEVRAILDLASGLSTPIGRPNRADLQGLTTGSSAQAPGSRGTR
jgi:hypothetical protein